MCHVTQGHSRCVWKLWVVHCAASAPLAPAGVRCDCCLAGCVFSAAIWTPPAPATHQAPPLVPCGAAVGAALPAAGAQHCPGSKLRLCPLTHACIVLCCLLFMLQIKVFSVCWVAQALQVLQTAARCSIAQVCLHAGRVTKLLVAVVAAEFAGGQLRAIISSLQIGLQC